MVEPRLLRRAVGIEDDVPIGIALGVGIEINIVVVRCEEDAVALAGRGHGEEVGQAAVRREDVRQAVVIAPALPVVLDEDGVGHAVACRAVESAGGLGVVAAPLVEAHLALDLGHAAGRLEAGNLAVGPRRRKRAAGRRHERDRRVVVGVQRVDLLLRVHGEQVGEDIAGLHQRQAAGIVRADVPRGELKAVGVQIEAAGILDHVAEARIDARGRLRGRAERQQRETRRAAGVARGLRAS